MTGTRLSYRYAKSLLDFSKEKGELDRVYKDMGLIARVLKDSHELEVVLKSPVINTDKKRNILNALFKKAVSNMTITFIQVILNKKREYFLKDIVRGFMEQYKKEKNITTAVITTAFPLDDEMRKKVREVIQENTDASEVEIIEKTDEHIIGGFILRVDDREIDASIINKLKDLNKTFMAN